jgi:hypothetical protein
MALTEVPTGAVRATILFVDSLIFRLLLAAIGPVIVLIADSYGLPNASMGLGLGIGLLVFWMMTRRRRVWASQ